MRGEIARLADNLIAGKGSSFARARYAEAFFVPHSTMASWIKTADKIISARTGGGAVVAGTRSVSLFAGACSRFGRSRDQFY